VLIGEAVSRSGVYAPLTFLAAALRMALSAASFAELAGRLPVAVGEAAYVREAFQSSRLAAAIGLLVVAIAIVSAAAISVGSAGYLATFLAAPQGLLVAGRSRWARSRPGVPWAGLASCIGLLAADVAVTIPIDEGGRITFQLNVSEETLTAARDCNSWCGCFIVSSKNKSDDRIELALK
jgi:amino acid transporter